MSNIVANKISLQALMEKQKQMSTESPIKPVNIPYVFINPTQANNQKQEKKQDFAASMEPLQKIPRPVDKMKTIDEEMIISRDTGTNTDNNIVIIPFIKHEINVSLDTSKDLTLREKLEMEYIEAYISLKKNIDTMELIVKKIKNLNDGQ